jgi:hypothetical protein
VNVGNIRSERRHNRVGVRLVVALGSGHFSDLLEHVRELVRHQRLKPVWSRMEVHSIEQEYVDLPVTQRQHGVSVCSITSIRVWCLDATTADMQFRVQCNNLSWRALPATNPQRCRKSFCAKIRPAQKVPSLNAYLCKASGMRQ